MPDTPSPPYAAFSPTIGMLNGQLKIALMSMSRDPGAIYWIEPADARTIAAHLNALADHLDPPKPEWKVVEQPDNPNVFAARLKREISRAKRRRASKKRKAKD
jgi:hypothetical protein